MIPLKEAKDRWFLQLGKKGFKRLTVLTREKFLLAGYYYKAVSSPRVKTVILIHGIQDSSAGMAYLYEEYKGLGWNVLSIDLRSHGESAGTKITMGVKESEDLALWMNLLINRFDAREIYLHGVSMGGAVALMYAEQTNTLPFEVKGVISDSSYAQYDFIVLRILTLFGICKCLAWCFLTGASVTSFIYSGVFYFRMNPAKKIQNIRIPVLLFHGEKDDVVPVSLVPQMFDDAKSQGFQVAVIPDAPHIGAYFYSPTEYMEAIVAFCK